MRIWIYLIPLAGIAAILGGLALLVIDSDTRDAPSASPAPDSVLLLCDESIHPPVAGVDLEHGGGVLELFLRRSGIPINADYAPSHELLDSIRQEGQADLFVPGDDVYLQQAQAEGLVSQVYPVASLEPVILVRRGNPDGIQSMADLANPELRVAIVQREASAVGRVAHELLQRHGVSLAEHPALVTPPGPGAMDHARSVQAGEADAAIVWKTVATQFPRNTEFVEIPAEQNIFAPLHVALLTTGHHADDARRFAQFMAGSVARQVFEKYLYHVEWDDEY